MLMWQMSVENPKFQMSLQMFEKFPMFFSPPAPPMPMAPPAEGAPGAPAMDTTKLDNNQMMIEQEIQNQQGDMNA